MEKLSDHKFIVYCGDNNNALGICRSLGEKGIDPLVVLYTPKPYLLNHCKYVKNIYYVHSYEEGLDFIVNKWGNEPFKPFIYTMDEDTTILLNQHYDELIDKFYFFHCGEKDLVQFYMNKKNICDLAESCGIRKPKGELLKRGDLPTTLSYPVLTKVPISTMGAWKKDVFICQNEDELRDAYKHIKSEELLVQEYIEKKNELCIDGISLNGGEDIVLSYTSEYLRMGKQSFGNYMLMKLYENEEMCAKIRNIIKQSHYTGIFDLECIITPDDELFFLEVNYRNSAWSYAHTFGGMNLLYYWAKWTIEGKSNYEECNIRKEPFTAMGEIADFSFVLHDPNTSLWTWYKQFRACDCTYTYNSADPKPFYFAIWHKVKTAFRHKVLHK